MDTNTDKDNNMDYQLEINETDQTQRIRQRKRNNRKYIKVERLKKKIIRYKEGYKIRRISYTSQSIRKLKLQTRINKISKGTNQKLAGQKEKGATGQERTAKTGDWHKIAKITIWKGNTKKEIKVKKKTQSADRITDISFDFVLFQMIIFCLRKYPSSQMRLSFKLDQLTEKELNKIEFLGQSMDMLKISNKIKYPGSNNIEAKKFSIK